MRIRIKFLWFTAILAMLTMTGFSSSAPTPDPALEFKIQLKTIKYH